MILYFLQILYKKFLIKTLYLDINYKNLAIIGPFFVVFQIEVVHQNIL